VLIAEDGVGFIVPSIVPPAVLSKKGKCAVSDADRAGAKEFGRLRKWHAGVESEISNT
jgi:hypothetical protein